MKLFGYELTVRLRKVPKDPAARIRQRLLDQAADLTATWAEARANKLWLNIWIDWSSREVEVRRITSAKIDEAEVFE